MIHRSDVYVPSHSISRCKTGRGTKSVNIILPLTLVAGLFLLYLAQKIWDNIFVFAAAQGDEDIKIAGDTFSQPSSEDISELAAQEFLRRKSSGDIDRARGLGQYFANALIDTDSGPLAGELANRSMQMRHHQYLLYSYVVNRVIAEHSPDSILAQTSLNVFYSEIEQASDELHRHVSDMAAFSLYILCERSAKRTDEEIGAIFAGLCGEEGVPETVAYGRYLYCKLYDICLEKIREIPYVNIK